MMALFECNDISIRWETAGRGEPVALLNGVLMTLDSWKLQTAELSRSYRCLLHDFRGQLLSSKPEKPWTLADHVADFLALLDHLDIESCHVVGTSYGGEVGLLFAAEHPERVRSLAVISSVSEIGEDVDRAVLDWRRAADEKPESLYRTMLPTTFSDVFAAANPRLLEQGEERLAAAGPDFFKAFVGLIDAFRQLDLTPRLPEITCLTLVMVGEEDRLKPPRYSRLIADRIPNSELVVIPGAGHAVILEQPGAVNAALLDFLQRAFGKGR
ncbi:MAG: alpha/beta hydrolase, partial [Gammaproteobacteria bacterium]|nr:alpha/beta hydrolase [Gammaproteobacteria bacterium]NNK33181.1 alpha/beta fold hydrolase [Xanthomonadales bacterium]